MTRVGIFVSTIFWGYTAAQAQQYVIDTYAGGAAPPITGLATGVAIGPAVALTTGKAGAIYFGTSSSLIFRLDPNGILTRVAGSGRRGYRGDGGPAINAQISVPAGLAVDAAGNLFIADSANNCIRKVFPNGIIVTVAGDGTTGFSGDGGPATAAQLSSPRSLAVDPAGALFIGDSGNSRIRKVAASGIITTVAGNGTRGSSGDGGPAVNAQLMSAVGLALDGAGNLFLTDDNRVRKVSPDGTITTVAGTGIWGFSGDGGPATAAQLAGPISLAVDSAGDLFIVANARIRQVSADGTITTVAGNGADGFSGDGGQASDATFLGLGAVAVDSTGNLFIADGGNRRIRKVSAAGTITTVAGNGGTYPCVNVGCPSSGDGSPAAAAQLATPVGIAADRAGNVFVAESSSGRVRRISPDGSIATVAGIGGKCNSLCAGIAVDRAGNLFIADLGRVRKLSPEGILSEVVPMDADSVAVDAAGNLFVAEDLHDDFFTTIVHKVSPGGSVITVAGGGSAFGDGVPATSAALSGPVGLAVDGGGNLYIIGRSRVRKVSPDGIITTVAGDGTDGFSGDGGPAVGARLSWSGKGVALDNAGNLFIGDYNRIRKISPDGIITLIAGTGSYGFYGESSPAVSADLGFLPAIAVDSAGNVYATDWYNNVVHILRPVHDAVLISAVVDAASRRPAPISPGEIVVIKGAGLGPAELVPNQPDSGRFGTGLRGTSVSFNGTAAPILWVAATEVAAVVPYGTTGATAQVRVSYQGQVSGGFTVDVGPSAPGLFTLNQSGAGQTLALNAVDGTSNTAANPVRIGDSLTLYATGVGQTDPPGVDGQIADFALVHPLLPMSVTVGGVAAQVQSVSTSPGQVAGLMLVKVQIPGGVQPGGYAPIVLRIGEGSSSPAVWIAVSND